MLYKSFFVSIYFPGKFSTEIDLETNPEGQDSKHGNRNKRQAILDTFLIFANEFANAMRPRPAYGPRPVPPYSPQGVPPPPPPYRPNRVSQKIFKSMQLLLYVLILYKNFHDQT